MHNHWLLFVGGALLGVVATRHLIALPGSKVIFGKFDQREIDAIVNDPSSFGDDELDGGAGSRSGGRFTFSEREL